ncbi:hypothetical protein ACFYW1_14900 [Streptomyces sp. NPDC002669]|uniref:hypothetical protein n=1 Tax=Streptomyces sp. NPDC002669 TaxID=3364658 RepID=UPI0036C40E5D
MPFDHIAHVLGVTVPAVKKYAGRARRRLAPSRTPPERAGRPDRQPLHPRLTRSGGHAPGAGPAQAGAIPAINSSTRDLISSRIGRTASTPRPAGSSSRQSR